MYFMVAIPWKSLSLKHRYACLGFETCHNICLMVVCIFFQVLRIHTLAQKSLQSTSVISSRLLTSHFGGQYVTHQNYSLQWWPIVIITSVAFLVASVANIILSSCLCRVSNDITRTLKTPSNTGLIRRNHLMKSTNLFPWRKLLKNEFWRETLPYPLSGSVETP